MAEPTASSKRCTKCGETKPASEFYRDRSRRDGLRSHCKPCFDRKRTPGARRAQKRRLRVARPEKWRADRRRQSQQQQAARRTKVFDHYGWACACCGATDDLTIDHLDGSGRSHRLELFGVAKKTGRIYGWLIREGFPDGFATLCRRCNSSKFTRDACGLHPQAAIWKTMS